MCRVLHVYTGAGQACHAEARWVTQRERVPGEPQEHHAV